MHERDRSLILSTQNF